jgi:hypothetical protein
MTHTHSKNRVPFYVEPREGEVFWKGEIHTVTKFKYSTYALNNDTLCLYKHHKDEEGHIWSTCIVIIPLTNIEMFLPDSEQD